MADPHVLFSDKLNHAYRRAGTIFIHGAGMAVLLAAFLLTELPVLPVLAWLAFVLAATGYNCRLGKRLLARERPGLTSISNRPLIIFSALAGLGWGAAAIFLPFISPKLQLLLILALTATGAASLPRMAALPAIHAAFMAGLFIPVLIGLIMVFGTDRWMMALVVLIFWGVLTSEARQAHADLVEVYGARQTLREEASNDKLTGIPNRRQFDATLEMEWRRAQRLGVPLSLAMIDVDLFKKFNDRFGHQAGDVCLAKVAKALADGPRRASDLVARYGGEEFVMLLFHTARDDAIRVAEKVREAVLALEISHPDAPAGIVSISVGGATCIPGHHDAAEALMLAADNALYDAKSSGRNRVVWTTGLPGNSATASINQN